MSGLSQISIRVHDSLTGFSPSRPPGTCTHNNCSTLLAYRQEVSRSFVESVGDFFAKEEL